MPHVPGVNINDKLRVAASKGDTSKVLELLDSGATCDADRDGRTALHFASHYGHSDAVAALLLAGCDVNAPDFSGHTALQRAAAEGHSDVVQQLLKHRAQIDHQDDVHGNTALHEAAWKGYSRTLEALCKAKANTYIKNKGGFAPLHLACQNGHNQSCRVLLWSGCRPDIRNNYGDTPLHTSARYGHAGVMRILISARCNVNEQNKNGDTGLHISSAMGRRKLTRILLEAISDQTIQNKQGETALDIARRKNFADVCNMLTNPPPAKTSQVDAKRRGNSKKREKESGTSKDSKDSGSRHKEKHKKNKRGHKSSSGHHSHHHHERCEHNSPYGCHTSPSLLSPIQIPKLESLPGEPLKRGEQYYLDLAGNIRKGPVGVAYACYCVPFFRNVEKKMESDKLELMEHIDLAHDNLNAKISNLERRTRSQLVSISEGMKERMAAQKAECLDRVTRVTQQELARHGHHDLAAEGREDARSASPALPEESSSSSTSDEEEEEEDDVGMAAKATPWSGHKTLAVTTSASLLASEVAAAVRASSEVRFNRSKSDEVLSPRKNISTLRPGLDDDDGSSLYPAVLGRSTYDMSSMVESPTPPPPPPPPPPDGSAPSTATPKRIGGGGAELYLRNAYVGMERSSSSLEPGRDQDQDSGYKTKLHSSFESQASGFLAQRDRGDDVVVVHGLPRLPVKPSSSSSSSLHVGPPLPLRSPRVGLELPSTCEFDMNEQFYQRVSEETEKWYERHLHGRGVRQAPTSRYLDSVHRPQTGAGDEPRDSPGRRHAASSLV